MTIDIKQLQETTRMAIAQGKEEARLREAGELAAQLARQAANKAAVQEVIASIPLLCQKAAANGKYSVKIYEDREFSFHANPDGFNFPGINQYQAKTTYSLSHLGGPIYQACKDLQLETTVKHSHDGCGQAEWLEIWVSWPH